MKSDLDTLMQDHSIDALLVTGGGMHNPAMVYFTGTVHMGNADLIKLRGKEPVLFHASMERDEAAKSGLRTKSLDEYRLPELLKQADGDLALATALRYQKMFADIGMESGRVALYGKVDAGATLAIFSRLGQIAPGLELVGETDNSLLLNARQTKDTDEIARIRRMGKITCEVVGLTAEFLSSHSARDGMLRRPDGEPLTIGEVKRRINLWLAERGAENPEGTIFAAGYNSAVPHSTGDDAAPLRLGETIVFDIYPCEAGGGYFYDMTRTWCLGYATDEALALYEDVHSVYHQLLDALKPGIPGPELQKRTCDLFEARGHPTIRNDPQTQRGYVHSLGHGLGLNIHERPRYGRNATPQDVLEPGSVVTHEPGLYYPERKLGVRLEDTYLIRADGLPEPLGEFSHDLILPVEG